MIRFVVAMGMLLLFVFFGVMVTFLTIVVTSLWKIIEARHRDQKLWAPWEKTS